MKISTENSVNTSSVITVTGTAAAKECGMPLSTFRYRAEIYEKAKLL